MIWALPDHYIIFPHPLATSEEGILAWSDFISAEQVILAYRYGIFPWYSEGDPVLWWFPEPRFVLFPDELKVHKSMRQFLRNTKLKATFDQDFKAVISHCQTSFRKDQESTWIQPETITVYHQLHQMGYAHSVEVWDGDKLVGGLYGVAIGRVFFGESMFSKVSNASKLALVYLNNRLKERGFKLIDCQQETAHLATLGARSISRASFYDALRQNTLFCLENGDFHF